MKKHIFLYFLLISTISKSQTIDWAKIPVDISILVEHINYSKGTLLPKFDKGKFYYIDVLTKKKAFATSFEEAYPFINNSALVKKDGHYGIINDKGLFLIEPKYKFCFIPSNEKHVIRFNNIFAFDMLQGKEYLGYFIGCRKFAAPDAVIFKNKNKYGVRDFSKKIILEATYDSILQVGTNFVIAKRKDKIGVVDFKNKQIVPFEYSDCTILGGYYFTSLQTIGFKKENNWSYYKLSSPNSKEIIKSAYKCTNKYTLNLKNAIGVFEENKQYNVLFKDGKILDSYYDWISENAKIGIKNGEIYFINEDRSVYRYY